MALFLNSKRELTFRDMQLSGSNLAILLTNQRRDKIDFCQILPFEFVSAREESGDEIK